MRLKENVILLEQEQVDLELKQAFGVLTQDVKDVVTNEKSEVQQEGLETIIGLWLSGPYILKLFGKFVKYMEKIINKYRKTGATGNSIGDKILHFAESYHHVVMKPFDWVAGKMLLASKGTIDKKLQKKISHYLFMVVVGVLLGYTGYKVVGKVASAHYDWSLAFKTLKSSVSTGELYSALKTVLSSSADEVIAMVEEGSDDAVDAASKTTAI